MIQKLELLVDVVKPNKSHSPPTFPTPFVNLALLSGSSAPKITLTTSWFVRLLKVCSGRSMISQTGRGLPNCSWNNFCKKQECIPVGCVPSASHPTGPGGCLPDPPSPHFPFLPHPLPRGQTNTFENITLPQTSFAARKNPATHENEEIGPRRGCVWMTHLDPPMGYLCTKY